MDTRLDLVHLAILQDAADIANRRVREVFADLAPKPTFYRPGRFNPETRGKRPFYGDIFRADPAQSEKGGMCLSMDPKLVETLDDDMLVELHRIGKGAIRDAISKNGSLFVGLMVGEAREGRNYFDRFIEPGQQINLF
jgi:hypothetical protein